MWVVQQNRKHRSSIAYPGLSMGNVVPSGGVMWPSKNNNNSGDCLQGHSTGTGGCGGDEAAQYSVFTVHSGFVLVPVVAFLVDRSLNN